MKKNKSVSELKVVAATARAATARRVARQATTPAVDERAHFATRAETQPVPLSLLRLVLQPRPRRLN